MNERPRASGETHGRVDQRFPDRPPGRTAPHRHTSPGDATKPNPDARTAWYRFAARELGIPFSELATARLFAGIAAEHHRAAADRASVVALEGPDAMMLAVAPGRTGLARLKRRLLQSPDLRKRIVVSSPDHIRNLILRDPHAAMCDASALRLQRLAPDFSAAIRVTRWQSFALLLLLVLIVASAVLAPHLATVSIMLALGILFFISSILRLAAIIWTCLPNRPRAGRPPPSEADLPVYTVLVPLYREARIVTHLLAAMEALDYPRDRLDIKLLIEADDNATRAVIDAGRLGPEYQVLVAPPEGPRTKPKALDIGLELARGDFVTVYDAEDQPEPDQLREAVAKFAEVGPNVAVLQARLAYRNWRRCWLTRQFAIEYAMLFDVFLPALEALGLPIPLGGTSNHFRKDVLRRVGGWDPHNVTEDADLGMRLARCGFHTRILRSSTYEEAPTRLLPWLHQRSRWIKGWLQTYLVHMRAPWNLARELGPAGFVAFQGILLGGIAASSLAPVVAAIFIWQTVTGTLLAPNGIWLHEFLVILSMSNLLVGYGAALTLAGLGLVMRPMPGLVRSIPAVPVYWLLMSVPAVMAVIDLIRDPFRWAKTEHGFDAPETMPPILEARREAARPARSDQSTARRSSAASSGGRL